MASIKERHDKIPAGTRYSAAVVAIVVGAASILGSFMALPNADVWKYIVYAGGGVALLISLIVYYYQTRE